MLIIGERINTVRKKIALAVEKKDVEPRFGNLSHFTPKVHFCIF